ncbi:unnamed protein product [Rotaria magnacalcarata]|uniref:Uncharacterized protein n=1 Tax=Rotaria magnacalcarata TaxID=392030 RepID=A0A816XXX3_9BILA|nr:unnamed protein product [Rotaria magnacalcarata]CAF3931616.1 unnamed protein product [Rotaria magnacalcarata]
MRRHTQNYNYRNYSFLFPTSSTHLRNTHYQYYNPRLRLQQNLYSNATPTSTYSTPRSQYQSQTLTTISDLPEPISVFDTVETSKNHQSPVTPLPVLYRSENTSRPPIINNERFAKASAMRERLLKDIQRNINEIDQELSSLKGRPPISRHISQRLPPLEDRREILTSRTIALSNDEDRFWPNKPKRVYQVVPRISSEIIRTSQSTSPKLTDNITPDLFVGQYHYGVEIDEMEILDDDPENTDFKSTFEEVSRFNAHEIYSLNRFRREQSDATKNRALVFIPQYIDNLETRINELTEELHQNNLTVRNILQSSAVTSVHELSSVSRYDSQDFQLHRQTAAEPKLQNSSESLFNSHEPTTNKIESNSNNTMLLKPIKHSHLSTNTQEALVPSSQRIKSPENNMNHVSSDVHNEFQSKEQLKSVDTGHLFIAAQLERISDDQRKNTFMKESHTSQQQQQQQQQQEQTNENNTQHVKETETKKIDETPRQVATVISASPSKKVLPISIFDDMQIQSTRNNDNTNGDQRYT